jgi:NAD(P)-dependent dehydrogenase (short-subunit alcohol dehydrogenase family)
MNSRTFLVSGAGSGIGRTIAKGLSANAGVGGDNTYGEGDRWQEIINTNLSGSYYFAREAHAHLIKAEGHKHLVFISSILARLGVPGYTAYCASKAGLLGLTRSLASEWTADKILVNAICPGWVNTEMAREGVRGFATYLTAKDQISITGQCLDINNGALMP